MVGYGPDLGQPVVEFKTDFNATEYTKGNGYEKVKISFFFFFSPYYFTILRTYYLNQNAYPIVTLYLVGPTK